MSGRFSGKIAIITGGGSGIGEAAALALATEGAKVVIADRDPQAFRIAERIVAGGGEAIFVQVDVADSSQVQAMVETTVQRYGRLDIAFNNAGCGKTEGPLADYDEAVFDQVVAVNLRGVFLCMKYELRQFVAQGGGVIVNTSSGAGLAPVPHLAGYCASKYAVIGLTKVAAIEYASAGIRVNAVCPGMIDTPLLRTTMSSPAVVEGARQLAPIRRFGQPGEVADAVLWLCSDAASFITGVALPVDGGLKA